MASNSFGTLFKITTWGESHGKAIGVVIDGCPAGLCLSEEDLIVELTKRAPGKSPYTSPRKEKDLPEILSGVFDGVTTGAPISMIIYNQSKDSGPYEKVKHLLKPGHAQYTYQEKYGVFDYRGSGRASARETAARVMAGAVAKKLLSHFKIETRVEIPDQNSYEQKILHAKSEGDSIGGVVEFFAYHVPLGLGEPIYEKMEAKLSSAMMSIPATKAFEMGSGVKASSMLGSEHNDQFYLEEGQVQTKTNHSGGVLAGISNGMPLYGRVTFKPASSIFKKMETVNLKEQKSDQFQLPKESKHDPSVVIRALPVVDAMLSLVLADCLLMNRAARL